MKNKILLNLLITIFLTGCTTNINNPYKIKELSQLKSNDETTLFAGYSSQIDICYPSVIWTVDLIYNETNQDIICSNFSKSGEISEIDNIQKSEIEMFINTYYLITKEKLVALFPVENVSVAKKFPTKLINIQKFDATKTNDDFQNFEYIFNNGFLMLHHFCLYTDGKQDYTHLHF